MVVENLNFWSSDIRENLESIWITVKTYFQYISQIHNLNIRQTDKHIQIRKDMKKNSEKKIQNTKPYRNQNEILIFDYRISKDF